MRRRLQLSCRRRSRAARCHGTVGRRRGAGWRPARQGGAGIAKTVELRRGAPKIVVDCTRLRRVDFTAAGVLLNWAVGAQSSNKSIEFREVSNLGRGATCGDGPARSRKHRAAALLAPPQGALPRCIFLS